MHEDELTRLVKEREALIAYINVKLAAMDWHAVSDACCDIRELEAQIDVLSRFEPVLVSNVTEVC